MYFPDPLENEADLSVGSSRYLGTTKTIARRFFRLSVKISTVFRWHLQPLLLQPRVSHRYSQHCCPDGLLRNNKIHGYLDGAYPGNPQFPKAQKKWVSKSSFTITASRLSAHYNYGLDAGKSANRELWRGFKTFIVSGGGIEFVRPCLHAVERKQQLEIKLLFIRDIGDCPP